MAQNGGLLLGGGPGRGSRLSRLCINSIDAQKQNPYRGRQRLKLPSSSASSPFERDSRAVYVWDPRQNLKKACFISLPFTGVLLYLSVAGFNLTSLSQNEVDIISLLAASLTFTVLTFLWPKTRLEFYDEFLRVYFKGGKKAESENQGNNATSLCSDFSYSILRLGLPTNQSWRKKTSFTFRIWTEDKRYHWFLANDKIKPTKIYLYDWLQTKIQSQS